MNTNVVSGMVIIREIDAVNTPNIRLNTMLNIVSNIKLENTLKNLRAMVLKFILRALKVSKFNTAMALIQQENTVSLNENKHISKAKHRIDNNTFNPPIIKK